jgi:hypothetical protein
MKRLIPFAVIISLVFLSCEKEGPAGPAGPAGPTGSPGPGGASGPAGPPGTANVIYSEWLDITYDTVNNAAGETVFFIDTIQAPKLDNAILTNGEVKVYFNWGTAAAPSVEALPLTDLIFLQGLNIYPTFEPGVITLVANANAGTANSDAGKVRQYRYILVPGGVPALKAPNLDWGNYGTVKSYLKLTN